MAKGFAVAAMTMVHNERYFLQQWIAHYAPLVGRENLYVLVHGGEEDILQELAGCRVVYLPRRRIDWKFDRSRFAFLNAYADFLLQNYDCVIAGDVDELVFVDPDIASDLVTFVAGFQHLEVPVLTTFGFHLLNGDDGAAIDRARPVFGQRALAVADADYCKPLIAFQPPKWFRGYHSSGWAPYLPDGLYMAHLRCVDRGVAGEVAADRRETAASMSATKNQAHNRFWNHHDLFFKRMHRLVRQEDVRPFDECIHGLVAELRGNVVENHAGRGGKSVRFTSKELIPMRLPDRFARVGQWAGT